MGPEHIQPTRKGVWSIKGAEPSQPQWKSKFKPRGITLDGSDDPAYDPMALCDGKCAGAWDHCAQSRVNAKNPTARRAARLNRTGNVGERMT